MAVDFEARGFDEAVEYLGAVNVSGKLEKVIDSMLPHLGRLAMDTTPVETGSMRRAWRWTRSGLTGRLFIDPSAVNSRSGVLVSSYAPKIEGRLGIIDRTVEVAKRLGVEGLERMDYGN